MTFALAAITFGLVAGLQPGPLGVFVIHQTMSKSNKHGFFASLAPILTDGPIILFSLLLTVQLSDIHWFISGISIAGSLYLANIALKVLLSPNSVNPDEKNKSQSSLAGAVKINFLNPSPYIFWLTIGVSYLSMGTKFEAGIFIIFLLSSLCLTKISVAIIIKTLGQRFNPQIYALILKSLAFPLFVFSGHLLYKGIDLSHLL